MSPVQGASEDTADAPPSISSLPKSLLTSSPGLIHLPFPKTHLGPGTLWVLPKFILQGKTCTNVPDHSLTL